MNKYGSRRACVAVLAAAIAVAGAGSASSQSAQTVSVNYTVTNSFGAVITLDTSSCTPSTTFSPPASIASGATVTFSASAASSDLQCSVSYQNGANGCRFDLQYQSQGPFGPFPVALVSVSAYKGTGGRPNCSGNGTTGTNAASGTFTMQ
ncbi:hypothetical protein ACVIJ6_004997 [Bradyrhizobium sp. USDA 4369]